MEEIKWFYSRFKAMSPAEISYRLFHVLASFFKNHLIFPKRRFDIVLANYQKIFFVAPKIASRYKNLYPIFDTQINIREKIDWYKDPKIDKRLGNLKVYWAKIKPGNEANIRYIWEVNRMQFLPQLALERNFDKIREHIESWIADNPDQTGPNWTSNIEINFRLISWFVVWQIIAPKNSPNSRDDYFIFYKKTFLGLIYRHCQYSYDHPSLYSSANNHRIGELVGLFVASAGWGFPESQIWNKYAQKKLESEILKQHSVNGINKEEAFGYALCVADLLLLAFIVGKKSAHPLSRNFKESLYKILSYIYHATDSFGNSPNYGDSDDSFAFNLEPCVDLVSSLLTSAAIIFRQPVFKTKSKGFDLKNQFYFGNEGKRIFDSLKTKKSKPKSAFYPQEGHFYLKDSLHQKEIYVHLNAAKLGYLSIAAHGHADALSFCLNYDGLPIFIDPGTFTYFGDSKWRKYFWGTSAHNSLTVDEEDQAKQAGPALHMSPYHCRILNLKEGSDVISISAEHDGYRRLGVIHQRKIIFAKKNGRLTIFDRVIKKGKKERLFFVFFHLHPAIKIIKTKKNNQFWLSQSKMKNEKIFITLDPKFEVKIFKGNDSVPLGWYSESFGRKIPSPTFICQIKNTEKFNFKTIIEILKCVK